ncbi:MAG TPA: universal stress protein [Pseudonocardiaceae bacterium]|nr:universal stress protein [Pseudonocardiaceae bacterium]
MGDYVRRVIVGVDGSMGSLQALRHAAAVARDHDATVHSVLVYSPPGGEGVERRAPNSHLRKLWETTAHQRLRTAWDEALGGLPADLPATLTVASGFAGKVLVELATQEGDLLVIGAGSRAGIRRWLSRSVSRYCVSRARSRVLTVPSSVFARELGHGLPRVLRHRRITRELAG